MQEFLERRCIQTNTTLLGRFGCCTDSQFEKCKQHKGFKNLVETIEKYCELENVIVIKHTWISLHVPLKSNCGMTFILNQENLESNNDLDIKIDLDVYKQLSTLQLGQTSITGVDLLLQAIV